MKPNRTTTIRIFSSAIMASLAAVALAAGPNAQGNSLGAQYGAGAPTLAGAASTDQAWAGKVERSLLARASSAEGNLDVLIAFSSPETLAAQAAALGAPARLRWIRDTGDGLDRDFAPAGLRVLRRFTYLSTVYVSAPASMIAALAADPRVKGIAFNHHVHKVDINGRALMHVGAIQPPYSGSGVGIAILDTGVDWTHPELSPLGTKTIALFDYRGALQSTDPDYVAPGSANYAKDDDGHGTEVAGVAAAIGVNPSAIGVAPAATILSVKVLDSSGNGTDTEILEGINAILASVAGGNPYHIRVANLSLGGYTDTNAGAAGVPDQPCDDPSVWPLVDAFQQLTNAGVVPVVSSGNGGCTNGVAWPACISTSLAVGSVYEQAYQYASFGGPLQCLGSSGCTDQSPTVGTVLCFSDSGAKLDVWAPTGAITPLMGGGYGSDADNTLVWGTSYSAPYVSGVAALLAQASPASSATAIRDAIRNNGQPITDPRNGITRNLVIASQALNQLVCTTPAVPSGLAANTSSACAGQSFVVSWGAASGANSYTLQVATDPSFTSLSSFDTASTSFNYSSAQSSSTTFYFRVRANATCGASSAFSSAVHVSYTPSCTVSYGHTYYVSGVARTPGFAPAYWYTDLSVLNVGTTSASLKLTFYGSAFPSPVTLTLGGHQQITWTDVVGTLFGLTTDKGMIVLESTQPVHAISRTYSRVTGGTSVTTYGQAYVGMEASEGLAFGQVGYFGSLRSDGVYRTNLEFLNASNVSTSVQVLFFSNAGTQIGTLNVTVPPLRWVQQTLALPSGQSGAFAEVRTQASGSSIISWATVVDGSSTDPTGIALWIP